MPEATEAVADGPEVAAAEIGVDFRVPPDQDLLVPERGHLLEQGRRLVPRQDPLHGRRQNLQRGQRQNLQRGLLLNRQLVPRPSRQQDQINRLR